MKKIYKIYILKYNDEIIYVGQTSTELKRRKYGMYRHIPKEIVKNSSIELIEETTEVSHEKYWINYFKEKGCNLYNREKGDGFIRKETASYNSVKRKEYIKEWLKNNPDYMKNYRKTSEKRKKYNKEWLEKNPNYQRDYMREYRKRKNNEV